MPLLLSEVIHKINRGMLHNMEKLIYYFYYNKHLISYSLFQYLMKLTKHKHTGPHCCDSWESWHYEGSEGTPGTIA